MTGGENTNQPIRIAHITYDYNIYRRLTQRVYYLKTGQSLVKLNRFIRREKSKVSCRLFVKREVVKMDLCMIKFKLLIR